MGRVFLIIGAAVALVCAGCGSGSSSSSSSRVSARAYTTSVCRAFITWEGAIKRTLAVATASASTTAQGKSELESFFKGAGAGTQKIVAELEAAGVPDVKNGEADSKAVITAFRRVTTAMQQGFTQAQTLPTGNLTGFKAGAQSLMSKAQTSFTGAFGGLSGLRSAELDAAAKSNPACAPLVQAG
jgi:hypothetical protein